MRILVRDLRLLGTYASLGLMRILVRDLCLLGLMSLWDLCVSWYALCASLRLMRILVRDMRLLATYAYLGTRFVSLRTHASL